MRYNLTITLMDGSIDKYDDCDFYLDPTGPVTINVYVKQNNIKYTNVYSCNAIMVYSFYERPSQDES